jgi:general secretion pathway protein J
MTSAPLQRSPEAGFTLVELLVAITLVGLLTVVMFGGLRFGTRAADAVGARTDRAAQLGIVYDFMQNELTDARLPPASNDPTAASTDFDGEPDSLSFVTVPPGYLALGGFNMLRVALEGEQTRRLTVTWRPIPHGSLPMPTGTLQPSVILEKIRTVEFGYFGTTDQNRPPEWQDRWNNQTALPLLVRLKIAWADGSAAPDLVIAPRMAGPPQLPQ